jgi:Hint module/Fasciclin domain
LTAVKDMLTTQENGGDVIALVKEVILYHVAPVRLSSKDVLAASSIETLASAPPIKRDRKTPLALIDEATSVPSPNLVVGKLDIPASNGFIHVIDRVLLPFKLSSFTEGPIQVAGSNGSTSGGAGSGNGQGRSGNGGTSGSAGAGGGRGTDEGGSTAGGVGSGASQEPSAEPSVEASGESSPEETSPEKLSSGDHGVCFPASAFLHTPNGIDIAMHVPAAGVSVKVSADPAIAPSKIYFFSHKTRAGMHDFASISTSSGHVVTLSAIHYLYANGKLTAASAVKIGDVLHTLDGPSTVSSITTVRERGLYAPHTLHGDIVVNRVVVSSYTRAMHPTIAHALLAPVRSIVHLGLSDEPVGEMMYEGAGRFLAVSRIIGGPERLSV